MKACSTCGSSARLRFDREQDAWTCAPRCALANLEVKSPQGRGTRKPARGTWKKREALFSIWVTNPETNEMSRATRDELRTANYLWYRHKDIREGRVHA